MKTIHFSQHRNLVTALHLSVFTKYFIPFGNFIFPMLLWLTKKEDDFVDTHGRNAINFQISLFLYTVLIVSVGLAALVFFGVRLSFEEPYFLEHGPGNPGEFSQILPFFTIIGVFGILMLALFILELFAVINASIKASEGKLYKFPLSINFLGSDNSEDINHQNSNQSKNEQFNSTQK